MSIYSQSSLQQKASGLDEKCVTATWALPAWQGSGYRTPSSLGNLPSMDGMPEGFWNLSFLLQPYLYPRRKPGRSGKELEQGAASGKVYFFL